MTTVPASPSERDQSCPRASLGDGIFLRPCRRRGAWRGSRRIGLFPQSHRDGRPQAGGREYRKRTAARRSGRGAVGLTGAEGVQPSGCEPTFYSPFLNDTAGSAVYEATSAETSLKAELLPAQHEPAHVEIRQQWRERRPLRDAAPMVSRLRRPRLPSSFVGFFHGAFRQRSASEFLVFRNPCRQQRSRGRS